MAIRDRIKGVGMSLDPDAKNWLRHRFGRNVKFDEPMSKHTYFKIGGPVDAFVVPQRPEDLVALIAWVGKMQQPYMVIGDGTNLLVRDAGIRGLVIVLTKCLKTISRQVSDAGRIFISAMAGARLQALCKFAIDSGLEGMNFAIGIPGTVGGGIMMNAGTTAGSMADVIDAIEILLPDGRRRTLKNSQLDFGYRTLDLKTVAPDGDWAKAIILEGRFRVQPSEAGLLKKEARKLRHRRAMTQPLNYASAGCVFKNPAAGKTAGELIDLAGLKGKSVGGAEISTKHANFIINTGNATAADVMALMEIARETVMRTFNIELKPEVKIVGNQI